jgi:hypothetical protein
MGGTLVLSSLVVEVASMSIAVLSQIPTWEWSEGAVETVVEALGDRDGDVSERVLAARLAGEIGVVDDRIAGLLLDLLGDPDEHPEVRAGAATALGPALEEFEENDGYFPEEDSISAATFTKTVDRMAELYRDSDLPKLVRRRVLEGSIRAAQDWHAEAVREAYASDDPEWQLTAVFCMEFLPGFEREILESLASDDEDIEFHAVIAAGLWGIDEAWRYVAGLVESPETDKILLLAAIDAAVQIRPEEASVLFVDLFDADDEEVVEAVHEALALAQAAGDLEGFDDDLDDV